MTSSASEYSTKKHYNRHTTYLERHEYDYTWKIHSFCDWLAEIGNNKQYTPLFPSESSAPIRWKIAFDPVKKKDDKTYCSLFLHLVSAPKSLNIQFKVMLNDVNGGNIWTGSTERATEPMEMKVGHTCGWNDFIDRKILLHKLPSDILIITCHIEVVAGIVTDLEPAYIQPCNNLGIDLAVLVEGEQFGDATIIVGERKFSVYKGILAARSSVFAAMFKHDMVESIQKIVTITDIEEEVFKELLRYIYTDRVVNLKAYAYQLFAAADKYDMLPLKTLCQQAILANLSVENAAKTLQLADLHRATEMKARALQFLSSGASRGVTDTAEWNTMARTHPHLVVEAFKAIDSKKGGAKAVST